MNGQLVCHSCGLTERMIISDHNSYLDVDWQGSSMVTKSQHVPIKYLQDLIIKFGIRPDLRDELVQRYKAFIFWSNVHKPGDRKSLPS